MHVNELLRCLAISDDRSYIYIVTPAFINVLLCPRQTNISLSAKQTQYDGYIIPFLLFLSYVWRQTLH